MLDDPEEARELRLRDLCGRPSSISVHIRKDGREIGRWDIEHQKKMDEFRLTREIMDGLRVLGYLCTI